MDISKASNFERFVFDLVGRDAATVSELWGKVDGGGAFDLAGTPHFSRLGEFGFVSGRSTHADRLATIRQSHARYGVTLDTHTADGLKVGLEHREPGVPLVCLETAQACKFSDTIREALGHEPERPAAMQGIENLPQRFVVMDASAPQIKNLITGVLGA